MYACLVLISCYIFERQFPFQRAAGGSRLDYKKLLHHLKIARPIKTAVPWEQINDEDKVRLTQASEGLFRCVHSFML